MKIYVRFKGIFCESGELVDIKGRLSVKTFSINGHFERLSYQLFSSFRGPINLPDGDERPITLAAGDLYIDYANYEVTLQQDILEIGGSILGSPRYITLTTDDLIILSSPKTYHIRFEEGSKSVRAQIEVELISA